MPDNERIRATFALPEDELNALKEIANRRKISVTDALRQALALSQLVETEIAGGKDVILRDKNNANATEQKIALVR
jgi:hypothetical protein